MSHESPWNDLLARLIEDNLYLTPRFLLPNLKHFGDRRPFRIVFVYRGDRKNGRLVLVAAFSINKPSPAMPLVALATLQTPHGYHAVPLVDQKFGQPAVSALWDWIEEKKHSWRLVLLDPIAAESPVWQLIDDELNRRKRRVWLKSGYRQAALARPRSFDQYFQTLSGSRRKGYRRKLGKLEKSGPVQVLLHRNLDVEPLLAERFLDLERSTWKGRQGTALASEAAGEAFFRELVDGFAKTNSLFFVELKQGDRTIALTTNFIQGKTLFAFKTAYDPQFADYSPGVLAEVLGVQLLTEQKDFDFAEGANTADSYILSYWRELIDMQVIAVATPRLISRSYLRIAPFLQRLARRQGGPVALAGS